MAVVTYNGTDYRCAKALKGPDYIHLIDDSGLMVASFDKVINFSAFTISEGTWTTPTSDDDCYVAVVREDGTIGMGSHKCSDIGAGSGGDNPTEVSSKLTRYEVTLPYSSSGWTKSGSVYTKLCSAPKVTTSDFIILDSANQGAWARSCLSITINNGSILFTASALPTSDCTLYLFVMQTSETIILS